VQPGTGGEKSGVKQALKKTFLAFSEVCDSFYREKVKKFSCRQGL